VLILSGLLLAAALAGCGSDGGGGGGGGETIAGGSATVSASPANATATNPNAAFTAVTGIPLVTISSPPQVNFTAIYSNGGVVPGLTRDGISVTDPQTNQPVTCNNVSFALAKLVPGASGDPDQWVNYIQRTEAGTPGVGPDGVVQHPNASQATTDPTAGATLVFNAGGYYTYTFSTDVTESPQFEPGRTHRVAIQMCFVDIDGSIVRANPYYDFTLDANGNSVTVTDPAQTRKVSDVSNCNTCHDQLAFHGSGRVDTQFCVLCHNAGTTDANSGEVLDFRTMVHKLHAGRRLNSMGEQYRIWGEQDLEHDYSELGFPQDLRNCTKCHDGSNPNTPQGDNWKTKPTKEACLACHHSDAASRWFEVHVTGLGGILGEDAASMSNSTCGGCHGAGKTWSSEQVHWNQNEENAAKYKFNIEAATYDAASRQVTVRYSVTDPTNNTPYDLREDCAGACTASNRFGNLTLQLAYLDLVGAPAGVADYTSFNNGGSGASALATAGIDDGSHRYTVSIALPADTPTAQAHGTARVISIGQVIEPQLDVVSREPVVPTVLLNVSMQHTFKDVSLEADGTLTPRREILADANCNRCHGTLGTTSGSNILSNAFHSGSRDSVVACPLCHDALRTGSNLMLDGSGLNESIQFKRMIHGIHGREKREHDFFIGDDNLSAGVKFPGILSDCTACHVVDPFTGVGAFENDRGVLGAVVQKPVGVTDPLDWLVISPKAATCTSCHDSDEVKIHVTTVGGAVFGTLTQRDILAGNVAEGCDGCHGLVAGFVRVRDVHNVPLKDVP
jgi:OmcA/MtrC family decaheme c-type cytochrome